MRRLLIAVGNPLRGDDGVAHRVAQMLGPRFTSETLSVLQLTPELAAEIADCHTVVFLDADAAAADFCIEPVAAVSALPAIPALTHVSTPSEIVGLSRALFHFAGRALTCRIPAAEFSYGEGLSARSEAFAARASEELRASLL